MVVTYIVGIAISAARYDIRRLDDGGVVEQQTMPLLWNLELEEQSSSTNHVTKARHVESSCDTWPPMIYIHGAIVPVEIGNH